MQTENIAELSKLITTAFAENTKKATKDSLREAVGDLLQIEADLIRIARITDQKNVPNRMLYESGWVNPAVMLVYFDSGMKGVSLPYLRRKVDEYVCDYPVYHQAEPRLRLVVLIDGTEIVAVDRVSYADVDEVVRTIPAGD